MSESSSCKLRVYRTLGSLNAGFEHVGRDLRKLESLGVFQRRVLRAFQNMAERVRTATNRKVSELLYVHEATERRRLERMVNRVRRSSPRARR